MTPLAAILARRIAQTGPITLADYMAECLLHPEHGYYTQRPVFGRAGDFVTAPETTQIFGELLGLALAQAWLDQGAPARVTLAELGPGRGTLMADALRAIGRAVPGFRAALTPVLVEASPALRALQAERLAGQGAIWAETADALPEAPLFLLANEFFDALPIRQFRRDGAGWAETVVGLADGHLTLGRSPPVPVAALAHRLDTPEGGIVELCPAAPAIMQAVAGRIARHGGAAIVIDYGGWMGTGDTFQAVRSHAYADPLAEPGLADLTAHVDFAPLAAAAEAAGAVAGPLTPQGTLLVRLGLHTRAAALASRLDAAGRATLEAAVSRLTDPAGMGTLFKALPVRPRGASPLAGFET